MSYLAGSQTLKSPPELHRRSIALGPGGTHPSAQDFLELKRHLRVHVTRRGMRRVRADSRSNTGYRMMQNRAESKNIRTTVDLAAELLRSSIARDTTGRRMINYAIGIEQYVRRTSNHYHLSAGTQN